MRILALDIGSRRTGIAYLDTAMDIPLPLETLRHTSVDELLRQVSDIAVARRIDRIVVGLPYLPDGSEGAQAAFVKNAISRLATTGLEVSTLDERYSTDSGKGSNVYDTDAAAACTILTVFSERLKRGIDK